MIVIRLALTTLLIFLSYRETGIWTAIIFLLLACGFELQTKTLREHKKAIETLMLRALAEELNK